MEAVDEERKMKQDPFPPFAIDLGTTQSRIGVWDWHKNEHVIIPNSEGSLTTPSVLCFTYGRNGDTPKLLVG